MCKLAFLLSKFEYYGFYEGIKVMAVGCVFAKLPPLHSCHPYF